MRVINIKSDRASAGFTLIELMITLAISGIIVAAIYSAYIAQQRTYLAQEQVAEMQQNIRAGLYMMMRDIRLAGYDPQGTANAGITGVQTGRVQFTVDTTNAAGSSLDGDGNLGDPGEMIDIGFSVADDATGDGIPDNDTDGDGVPDSISLRKRTTNVTAGTNSGFQAIADNIQAIEFRYLDSVDEETAVPANIRSIQLSILARAGQPDRKFTNTMLYCPASHPIQNLTTSPPQCEDSTGATLASATWGPYNDNFRRRLLTTTVNCRNMGL